MDFPPPHRILYEPLNDRTTDVFYKDYKTRHLYHCDFEEVDAAVTNSMEDFAKWFVQWMTFSPSRPGVQYRVLMIWHAHFLSLACQQMLRRSLEQRSFRCRVWFHVEEPLLQSAIISRCLVKLMPIYSHVPRIQGRLDISLWKDPRKYEMDLEKSMTK
jgi:hypothetical protein